MLADQIGGPDFSYAGYCFGLAPLPDTQGVVIEATEHGVIPDVGSNGGGRLSLQG